MRGFMGWMSALVLAVAMAGCAGTGTKSMPCEACKYKVSDAKATPPKIYCMVDGKEVDCSRNPSGCPECAKHMK